MKFTNRFKCIISIWNRWRKTICWLVGIGAAISIFLLFYAGWRVEHDSEGFTYGNIQEVPFNKVGLLLGTSKHLRSGQPNRYFTYRIAATTELYRAGKIRSIVISGDNSQKDYNEPQDMMDALVAAGIPADRIYLDYAGFRTFDSVFRMNKIFGQSSFTIISQEFHNRRAIYIARALGLNASGYNAKDVDAYNGFKTKVREKFARVRVLLDIWVGKQPKFLGERIEVQ